MTEAVRIHVNGGPEVLRYDDIALAPLGAGEARVRQSAIGVNFSDINVRRGGFYIARPQQFPLIRARARLASTGAGIQGRSDSLIEGRNSRSVSADAPRFRE